MSCFRNKGGKDRQIDRFLYEKYPIFLYFNYTKRRLKNMKEGLALWGPILLLVGGLVHLIPQLYTWLSDLTGGTPWIQIIVGLVSVIVALVLLFKQ